MLKVPPGGREVYIKEPQTKNRHNPLLYRLLQPAKLRRSDPQVIYLVLNVITQSDSLKTVGVLLDGTLSVENFISQTAKSCYYQLRRISSVRKYLSTEATVKLHVTSLILSRLNYGILLFSCLSASCRKCPSTDVLWRCVVFFCLSVFF